ncbi:MAG: peptidylprolyl isomerase [Thermoleophilia bacterium]
MRLSPSRLSLALLVCAGSLAAAACSGSDESASPSSPPPAPAPSESSPAPAPAPAPAESAPAPSSTSEPAPAESGPTESAPAESGPADTAADTGAVDTTGGAATEPIDTTATLPETDTSALPEPVLGPNEPPTPTSVPSDAIAIVGDQPVLKSAYDALLEQRKKASEAQGGTFPTVGTPEYETLKNQAVEYLVQRNELDQEAAGLGITVTEDEVQTRLADLKQQYFQGDETRYQEELTSQGLTEEQVLEDLRFQALSDALYAKVTEGVTVSDAEIQAYYEANKDTQFANPESRKVAHILVKTEKEAKAVKARLDKGEDFAAVAKEVSTDEGTKQAGGELVAVKGQTVAPFEKAAYALETGAVSDPVKSEFGWHVITALEDVKPASISPLDEVEPVIRSDLETERKGRAVDAWVQALAAKYEGKVLYATGFQPPPPTSTDPAATDTGS